MFWMMFLVELLIMVASGLVLGAMALLAMSLPWPQLMVPVAVALLVGTWLYRRIG